MKKIMHFLALLLCLLTALWGCHRSTTVILPPETAPSAVSTTEPNAPPTAEPTTAPATEPTAIPTTEPTTVPSSESTNAPVTEPTAVPTTEPTTVPTAAPTTVPTTEPTTVPSSEPTTAPVTEPSTVPTTKPTTQPTTAPVTEPTVVPTTEPTTVPATEPDRHPVYNISGHTVGSLECALLDAINQQRAAAELPGLSMDSTLCALAAIRSYECTESFSHTRPDGRGAYTVLADHNYSIWSNLDERIHHGSTGLPANTIIKGWMGNEAFSTSILSGVYTHIGIGIYTDGGSTYITCFFAG